MYNLNRFIIFLDDCPRAVKAVIYLDVLGTFSPDRGVVRFQR